MSQKTPADPLAEPPEADFTDVLPAPGPRPQRVAWTRAARELAAASPDDGTHLVGARPGRTPSPRPRLTPGKVGRPDAAPVSWRTQALRSSRRLHGLDLARFLALAGMMAVHIWADTVRQGGVGGLVGTVVAGNAAAVFAFLAGITLVFLSGGHRGARGAELTRARVGITVRAVLLLLIGLVLNMVDFPAYDILPYYAVLFLMAVPLLSLRARELALCAAVALLLGPVLRVLVLTGGAEVPSVDPTVVSLVTEPGATATQLLVTGTYPAVTWMAYVCAGMAAARLNLFDRQRQALLAVGGAAAMAAASALSWAALHVWDGRLHLAAVSGIRPDLVEHVAARGGVDAHTLVASPWWLTALGAHLDTPLSTLHAVGTAALVVGFVLMLTNGLLSPDGSLPAWTDPFRAAGSMSLTVYVAHLLLLTVPGWEDWRLGFYLAQVALLMALAWAWRSAFSQGPLETVVSRIPKAVSGALVPRAKARGSEGYEPLTEDAGR